MAATNSGSVATKNSRKPVPVYVDENATPSLLPDQNEEYASVPLPEVTDRENQLQPGRWTEAKVSILFVLYGDHLCGPLPAHFR